MLTWHSCDSPTARTSGRIRAGRHTHAAEATAARGAVAKRQPYARATCGAAAGSYVELCVQPRWSKTHRRHTVDTRGSETRYEDMKILCDFIMLTAPKK